MSKEIVAGVLQGDEEFDKFTAWVAPNTTEAEKLGYPGMTILAARERGNAVQFAMVHPVSVIEHLASDPDGGRLKLVKTLKALVDAICAGSYNSGIREVWCMFGYGDDELIELAEHYGFEKVPLEVWRKKL